MFSIKLYVGLNDRDVHRQLIDRSTARIIVTDALLAQGFTACTIYDVNGYWNGEREASLVVELVLASAYKEAIALVVQALKDDLNQASILVTVTKLDVVESL